MSGLTRPRWSRTVRRSITPARADRGAQSSPETREAAVAASSGRPARRDQSPSARPSVGVDIARPPGEDDRSARKQQPAATLRAVALRSSAEQLAGDCLVANSIVNSARLRWAKHSSAPRPCAAAGGREDKSRPVVRYGRWRRHRAAPESIGRLWMRSSEHPRRHALTAGCRSGSSQRRDPGLRKHSPIGVVLAGWSGCFNSSACVGFGLLSLPIAWREEARRAPPACVRAKGAQQAEREQKESEPADRRRID